MPAFVAGSASRTADSFSRSGMKGETTAPYDSQHALPARTAMSGYARPELLASAEWLADNIGRPGLRVLDVRWRPDGTGHAAYLAGHIPSAVHLDWATDLVEPSDPSGLYVLAGPEHVGSALSRAGVGDGTTVVLYDDMAALFSSRVWWSLRVYGFESARILDRHNVTRGKRLVCYDGSGVSAAKLAFVLTLLGHDDVAVYDGGWPEWGDRLDLPVDR